MNDSNVTADNVADPSDIDEAVEKILKIVDVTFLIIGICIGSCGNLFTILSVTRFKQLKSATNFLVVNIGMADLMVCAYSLPTILTCRLTESNVFHDIICKANAFLLFSAAGVSNFSFTLIAVARNLCVLHQPLYRRFFTHTRVLVYCIAFWFIWFGASGIFLWQEGFGYIPEAFICFYYDDDAPFALSFILTLFGVAIPSLLAAGCYISLFVRLFQIRKEADNSVTDGGAGTAASKEWKALAPVLAAFIVFNLCWGPYSIHVYIDKFVVSVGRIPHKVITWLAVFNSTLNPIIYGLLNPQFRRSYIRIFRNAFCCGRSANVAPSETTGPPEVSTLAG